MALNIGNINFGVEANTQGLQRAIAQIGQFQKVVDRTARSQAEGAQKQVRALSMQEREMQKALRAALNLRQQFIKFGASNEQLNKVTQAVRTLNTQMTRTDIKFKDSARAVQQFENRMNALRRQLNTLRASSSETSKATDKFSVIMRDLESSAVLALGPLSGLGARIRSIGAIFSRSSVQLALWVTGIAGAVIAIAGLTKVALTAGSTMQSMMLRFEAATGSAALAKREFAFVSATAQRLGLDVNALAKNFSRFVAAADGTAIEGEKARKIFTSIAKASAALKLEGTEVEGVMRALEQIMSKGTVQAEELRGQLGDRLPGAFRIAAEAMGVTPRELNRMLKAGEVMAEDFLPKFAAAYEEAVGKNAAKNAETLSGSLSNLKTATLEFGTAVNALPGALPLVDDEVTITGLGSALVRFYTGLLQVLTPAEFEARKMATSLEEVTEEAQEMRVAIDGTLRPVRELGAAFEKTSEDIDKAIRELRIAQEVVGFMDDIELPGAAEGGVDFLADYIEALKTLEGLDPSQPELDELSENLEFLLGVDVEPTIEGIAAALADAAEATRQLNTEMDRLRASPQIIADADKQIEQLRARLEALRQGPDVAELFDKVETQVREMNEALMDTTLTEAERNARLNELRAILTEILRLEDAHTQAKRDAAAASRELEQAERKRERALDQAAETIERARAQLEAMAKGPDALERFEKVEEPLIRMRQALEDANIPMTQQNELLKEYREILEGNLMLTDRFARANQAMADAVVNGFERILIDGGSVKDMLHELAKELLRVALRALFLDKLRNTLFGIFQGGGFPSILRPGGGGVGGSAPVLSGSGGSGAFGFSRGGDVKLTGSGGSDTIPFLGFGKAGEVVSVRRPDQMRANGGVTIFQENNFNMGSGDPQKLLPLLEANNRKLRAEIANDIDRGGF